MSPRPRRAARRARSTRPTRNTPSDRATRGSSATCIHSAGLSTRATGTASASAGSSGRRIRRTHCTGRGARSRRSFAASTGWRIRRGATQTARARVCACACGVRRLHAAPLRAAALRRRGRGPAAAAKGVATARPAARERLPANTRGLHVSAWRRRIEPVEVLRRVARQGYVLRPRVLRAETICGHVAKPATCDPGLVDRAGGAGRMPKDALFIAGK